VAFGIAGLDGAQIVGRRLAGSTVGADLEGHFLSLIEALHSSALDRADMDENVLASIFRLNKAETLLAIEPLYGSYAHRMSLSNGAVSGCAEDATG
jgi:hypothetical protein